MSALRVNRRAAGSPACVTVEREAEAAFPSIARLCARCLGARPAGLKAAFSGHHTHCLDRAGAKLDPDSGEPWTCPVRARGKRGVVPRAGEESAGGGSRDLADAERREGLGL